MRPADLFPEAKSASAKRLVQLGQRHDELRVEARDLQAQAAATSAEQEEAARELREAEARNKAFGDAAPRIKAAKAKLAKLEQVAAERTDAARIVRDAADQVDAEIKRHARQHSTSLWTELTKDASATTKRLTIAIEAVVVAGHDYQQAGVRATELMRLVDPEQLRTTRVPELPGEVTSLAKAAKIAIGSIRVPVPERPGGQGPVVSLAETVESAA